MRFQKQYFLLLLSLSMSASSTELLTCSKKSAQHRVALLELYTSEGCSSCPPADKLLGNIYNTTQLTPEQVIPLALHVDYWDYIGWKDRFANPAFTERQEWLSGVNHSRGIYTPEFFLNGQEVRVGSDLVTKIGEINAQAARASIGLTLSLLENHRINLELSGSTEEAGQLFFGVVENNLSSQINSGENKNRNLQHNFVMSTWGKTSLKSGNYNIQTSVDIPKDTSLENTNVVAFIQSKKGDVLQALSLKLCR